MAGQFSNNLRYNDSKILMALRPPNIISIELHGFGDASKSACAAANLSFVASKRVLRH